jgi:hypothetical protein
MHSLEDIQHRSVSKDELVVEYMDAMDALDIFLSRGVSVDNGWEGWLVYSNGSTGHSARYQGTTDLSSMPATSAIALVKAAIMQAHIEWQERPEVPGAELYFCIGVGS